MAKESSVYGSPPAIKKLIKLYAYIDGDFRLAFSPKLESAERYNSRYPSLDTVQEVEMTDPDYVYPNGRKPDIKYSMIIKVK